VSFTFVLPAAGQCPPRGYWPPGQAVRMADFLSVLGIIAFAVVMLGLIWALDRV
jgi:hypothetical protein